MVSPDWLALAPHGILGLTAMVLLLYDMIDPDSRNRLALASIATVGSLAALAASAWLLAVGVGPSESVSLFDGQLVVDGVALFFSVVFTTVAALVTVASYDYLADHSYQAEYYSLVVLATTGMVVLASANSLATAFVSLELVSLPSYALVAFLKTNRGSVEAGTKYFLIGALSSAVFVYGISLVYAVAGSLHFETLAAFFAEQGIEQAGVFGLGIVMIVGGVAFKTASVPFHFWAPEAYEGAPAPISGFLSSASKAAGFVLAFRAFNVAFSLDIAAVSGAIDWALLFQILAVVTMIVGNFAAAVQERVKRMLAYSSVGHAGYVLIGLAAITSGGAGGNSIVMGAAMMHLLVYGVMNTGAFLFVGMAEYWGVGRRFEDYNGLSKQAPMACVAMAIFMFSLAGLPPFGGFFSKYVLFLGAIQAGFWWLAAIGAVTSALSLYYYSRVVKAIWIEDPSADFRLRGRPVGLYAAVMLAGVLTVALLPAFGVGIEAAYDAASVLFA
ncbi:oxidoreductase [Halobacteriales archaeon QS_1_68_20]|nr:MAG: oxidoreductase [Halobacteriales archaeon QS_1_68_20]